MKHYLTKVSKAFVSVKARDLGGWMESEEYLSQVANARVFGNDWVIDNARVYGDVYSTDPS